MSQLNLIKHTSVATHRYQKHSSLKDSEAPFLSLPGPSQSSNFSRVNSVMRWFRSSRPAKDSLELANVNIKLARGTQDQKQALNYCKVATKELGNIKLSASLEYHDQIIAAYREHGEVLKKLGFTSEAMISYNTADKM
ncbi:hypothetical protein BGZ99_007025 [Dissophora globulifera]|uniref:Uncharacterized protein n=1 Tax=Dissophora globulifera TaxID=979702 RepID=A0A9P6RFC4_9FUNG|nr:hypothetical protein BGZ99_007025 [Dissophora globulifera]